MSGTLRLLGFLAPALLAGGCVLTRVVTEPADAAPPDGPLHDARREAGPGIDARRDHDGHGRYDAESDTPVRRDAESRDGGVPDGAVCPPGLAACDGDCVDLAVDPENCGACGNTCGPGAYCNGSCQCLPGLTPCSGACVDLRSDPDHCGSCGHACPPTARNCAEGNCVPTDCSHLGGRFESCGPGGAACVPRDAMDQNPLHCGGCDDACKANEFCLEGDCVAFVVAPDCTDCPCPSCGTDPCCALRDVGLVVCLESGHQCPERTSGFHSQGP